MKLITAPVRKALDNTPLGSTDGKYSDRDDNKVLVKFFGSGRYTLLVTEAEKQENGDYLLYGYCVSGLGPDCDEWGYTLFSELEAVRFPPFGLRVERDRYVVPGKHTVRDLI